MSKIACIDFDGTIVTHAYPSIGEPLQGAFSTLKELKNMGWKLILFTCREDDRLRSYLQEAVDFCQENGVEFDAVNESIPEEVSKNIQVDLEYNKETIEGDNNDNNGGKKGCDDDESFQDIARTTTTTNQQDDAGFV